MAGEALRMACIMRCIMNSRSVVESCAIHDDPAEHKSGNKLQRFRDRCRDGGRAKHFRLTWLVLYGRLSYRLLVKLSAT